MVIIMKKGLVMEGGAMRGMFTCGVIDVFMENNIKFDGAIGVSAGAAFGCNIKSEQIGRPVRYNKTYCNDKRYASYSHWLKTGDIFNNEFLYGEMIYELDPWDQETFEQNPMEFYCVATNIETGQPTYHQLTDGKEKDVLWIRASASIPVFCNPVEIDGHKYLDGGSTDSIPLQFLESKGYDKIVVIETQPYDYEKKPQKHVPFISLSLRKYPYMIEALKKRHGIYNAQKNYVKKQEKLGNVFVLRPEKPLNIQSITKDPNELERVYQLGREQALKHLDEIKTYLKK